MASREHIVERIAELAPEDLDALEEYLNRLQAAGADPVRRAFVRASLLTSEKLSPADEAAVEEALADDVYYSREELERILREEM